MRGRGSNAIGLFRGFMGDAGVALVGVEAAGHGVDTDKHAATLGKGRVGVLHGSEELRALRRRRADSGSALDQRGARQPGVGPEHAWLKETARASYVSATDAEALDAAMLVARSEGIIPALETSHAFARVASIAKDLAKTRGRPVTVLVGSSGAATKTWRRSSRI